MSTLKVGKVVSNVEGEYPETDTPVENDNSKKVATTEFVERGFAKKVATATVYGGVKVDVSGETLTITT